MNIMGTNTKEDFSESNDLTTKTEEFEDGTESNFDVDDKLYNSEPLEDALLGDPDNCGMCG